MSWNKDKIVWIAFVSYPVTTAAYFTRALKRMLKVKTLGPSLPLEFIDLWELQNMKLPIVCHEISTGNTPNIQKIWDDTPEGERPDLFLFVESVNIFLPLDFYKLPCPKVCYLTDNHVSLQFHLKIAPCFDFVFIAQRAYLEEFRKVNPNSYWLPLGCDPEIHFRYPVNKCYDIGFSGGYIVGARRWNLMNVLGQNFNFNFERLFWDDMARMFSESKLVFNNAFKDDLNMRYFEALSIGSLMLADMAHGSGLEELFIAGEDYALYTDDTIVDVARSYLTDDDKREQIARNGRALVHSAHTYAHRMHDMLDVVFNQKKDTYTALELRALSEESSTRGLSPDLARSPVNIYNLQPRIRNVVIYPPHIEHPIFKYLNTIASEIASTLGIGCKYYGKELISPDPGYANDEYDLFFSSTVSDFELFCNNHQLIVVFNDVWLEDFDDFEKYTKHLKLVYVTNYSICDLLQKRGCNNVKFLPFCISSKYVVEDIPEKFIDIVQYGRRNPVFDEYMERLISRYPHIHYVTTKLTISENKNIEVYFVSNKHGIVGRSDNYDEFMKMLSHCKISLVSSPGFDSERITNGCFTVAIRYFESASRHCHLVSRHPENDDFVLTGIHSICDFVSSFDEFESCVLDYMDAPICETKVQSYLEVLQNHTARQRAYQIYNDLLNTSGLRGQLHRKPKETNQTGEAF